MQLPQPKPEHNQFLLKVDYAAINFSDLLMLNDQYQVRPIRPFVPGQEVSGVVVEAPADGRFSVGDRVASKVDWGGFAEYVCARSDMAMAVPPAFDLAKAATLPVSYTTALVALKYCSNIDQSCNLLVHGAAGGIGLACIDVAVSVNANIIATAGTSARLEVARQQGAQHTINYRDENWYEQVRKVTAGEGANIIVDPVGGTIGENSLKCISRDGKLLIVGFASGTMPQLAPHRLLLKRASAVGVYWNHDKDQSMLASIMTELKQLIAADYIKPRIDDQFGFEELPAALTALSKRRIEGKSVLRVRHEVAQPDE